MITSNLKHHMNFVYYSNRVAAIVTQHIIVKSVEYDLESIWGIVIEK